MNRIDNGVPRPVAGGRLARSGWVTLLVLLCAVARGADELPNPLPDHPTPPTSNLTPHQPAAGEQEGPYYSAAAGRAGLLFQVSRTLEGEALNRYAADLGFEYARDWHRGDGGLGHWLAARGAMRYREAAVLGSFDERWFGESAATRAQALHLLFGGVTQPGHAQPFSEGGVGLCLWWPPATGRVRVLPEVGFRAVLWRLPRYRQSISAFRQGYEMNNSVIAAQLELYGSGAWNFRHKEGWIYDGGARVTATVLMLQVSLGYHLYGLRRGFAQGPAGSLAIWF